MSVEWYVRLESGRPIRVSMKFLERLSDALQLDRDERATLYILAIPELYTVLAHVLTCGCIADCGGFSDPSPQGVRFAPAV